jgi:hypothetical protein
MSELRLIETLKLFKLKGKEMDSLRKFVHSELYCSAALSDFFDAFENLKGDYSQQQLEGIKINVKNNQKDNQENHESKFRAYSAQLLALIEQFLIYDQLSNNTGLQQQLLAKAYNEKGNYKLFERTVKNELKVLKKIETDASKPLHEVFYQQSMLNEMLFFHTNTKVLLKHDDSLFTEMQTSADNAYLFQKLQMTLEQLARNTIYKNEKGEIPMLKAVLVTVDESDDVRLKIMSDIIKLYLTEENVELHALMAVFKEKHQSFPVNVQKTSFTHIQNAIIRKTNQGFIENSIMIGWYEFGLKSNILLDQGRLSETKFMNICMTCINEKKLDRYIQIRDSYQSQIIGSTQNTETVVALLEVIYYVKIFETNGEKETLNEAKAIAYKIKTQSLAQKLTLLTINFKIKFHECMLENNGNISEDVEALKRTLIIEKITDEKLFQYVGFAKLSAKIVKLNEKKFKREDTTILYNAIEKEIQNTQALANKAWLQEMLTRI